MSEGLRVSVLMYGCEEWFEGGVNYASTDGYPYEFVWYEFVGYETECRMPELRGFCGVKKVGRDVKGLMKTFSGA